MPKSEPSLTGQLTDDLDLLPSIGKRNELVSRLQRNSMGPNKIADEARPEWNSEVRFKRGQRTKRKLPYLLDSEDLEHEVAEGACTRIHLRGVSVGSATFVVEGSDLSSSSVSSIATEPHLYRWGNVSVLFECMSDSARIKRRAVSIGEVKDHGGLERK
jgi:hypothetical protein